MFDTVTSLVIAAVVIALLGFGLLIAFVAAVIVLVRRVKRGRDPTSKLVRNAGRPKPSQTRDQAADKSRRLTGDDPRRRTTDPTPARVMSRPQVAESEWPEALAANGTLLSTPSSSPTPRDTERTTLMERSVPSAHPDEDVPTLEDQKQPYAVEGHYDEGTLDLPHDRGDDSPQTVERRKVLKR